MRMKRRRFSSCLPVGDDMIGAAPPKRVILSYPHCDSGAVIANLIDQGVDVGTVKRVQNFELRGDEQNVLPVSIHQSRSIVQAFVQHETRYLLIAPFKPQCFR